MKVGCDAQHPVTLMQTETSRMEAGSGVQRSGSPGRTETIGGNFRGVHRLLWKKTEDKMEKDTDKIENVLT